MTILALAELLSPAVVLRNGRDRRLQMHTKDGDIKLFRLLRWKQRDRSFLVLPKLRDGVELKTKVG